MQCASGVFYGLNILPPLGMLPKILQKNVKSSKEMIRFLLKNAKMAFSKTKMKIKHRNTFLSYPQYILTVYISSLCSQALQRDYHKGFSSFIKLFYGFHSSALPVITETSELLLLTLFSFLFVFQLLKFLLSVLLLQLLLLSVLLQLPLVLQQLLLMLHCQHLLLLLWRRDERQMSKLTVRLPRAKPEAAIR